MSERYEASVNDCLAEFFIARLNKVLQADGFVQALHIPEPDVTEYQRGSHVVSVSVSRARNHDRLLVVESGELNLEPVIAAAIRETVVEIADALMNFIPSVDNIVIEREVDALLVKLLPPD